MLLQSIPLILLVLASFNRANNIYESDNLFILMKKMASCKDKILKRQGMPDEENIQRVKPPRADSQNFMLRLMLA